MRSISNHDRWLNTRWGHYLPVLCLLVLAAFGTYFAGRHLWARSHWRAAQAALEQHDFIQAHAHLQRCLEVRRGPETQFLAARTARRAGAYGEAALHLRECERQEGRTPAVSLEHL